MNNQIIFLKITWMRSYVGIHNDSSFGGGKFIQEHGWGHELFNFAPKNGTCYGNKSGGKSININKLGANSKDDKINNVTIIWTAPKKGGGVYIVGWYKNATLYRHSQKQPRLFRGESLEYFAECKSENAFLLSEDERILDIPTGTNGMGQANVWYAENRKEFVKKVKDYVFKGINPKIKKKLTVKGGAFQVDSIKRKKIENAAIRHIYKYYENLGYDLKSVETEKVGWDLEAILGKTKLLLEVKGLSGEEINIELTHNEFKQMLANKDDFRLCIVTKALTKPSSFIFSYSLSENIWSDVKQNRELAFKELLSARVTA